MRLGMLLGFHDPRRNRDAPNKNVDQSIIVGTKGEQMPLAGLPRANLREAV